MQTALVASGVVLQILVPVEGFTLAECFNPGVLAGAVEVADGVEPGWVSTDGGKTFAAPTIQPPSPSALASYARSAWAAVLAKGQTFNVAGSGQTTISVLCDGTNDTRADLALLALFGQANPTGTKTWLDDTGATTVLTGAQLVTLATLAGNWVSDTYPALVTLLGQIASGSITTTAAIDAYAWPTS